MPKGEACPLSLPGAASRVLITMSQDPVQHSQGRSGCTKVMLSSCRCEAILLPDCTLGMNEMNKSTALTLQRQSTRWTGDDFPQIQKSLLKPFCTQQIAVSCRIYNQNSWAWQSPMCSHAISMPAAILHETKARPHILACMHLWSMP